MKHIHHQSDVVHNKPALGECLVLTTKTLNPAHQIMIDGADICDVYDRRMATTIANALEGDMETCRQLILKRSQRETNQPLKADMVAIAQFIRTKLIGRRA